MFIKAGMSFLCHPSQIVPKAPAPAKPRDMFAVLAKGLGPVSEGILDDKADFSRPLTPAAGSNLFYNRVTVKVANSPVFVPDGMHQFSETIRRAVMAHAQNPDFDFSQSRGTMYVAQGVLKPGQCSLFAGKHMDTDIRRAILGRQPNLDIFIVSDEPSLTTRFYDKAIDIAPDELRFLPPELVQERFETLLNARCDASKSLCGEAFELVRSTELHVHEARPAPDPKFRTFVSVLFGKDEQMHVEGNPELRHWQMVNHPDKAMMAQQMGYN